MKNRVTNITILSFISMLAGFYQPVFADRYNVYTPTSYKQVQISQSPKNTFVQEQAIELIVDYSGSMTGWIKIAIDTLEYILPKIPQNSSVALRVFGERPSGMISYSDSCKSTRLVSYFKKDNQISIIKGLQETRVGGNTPLEFALRESVEKDLRSVKIVNKTITSKCKKIILVTDGGEGCGGDPCAYIRSIITTNKDLQIDVVQLGSSNNLMCLTAQTGGRFYKVDGSRQKFEKVFEYAFNVPSGTVDAGRKQAGKPVNQKPQTSSGKQAPARGYKFINF